MALACLAAVVTVCVGNAGAAGRARRSTPGRPPTCLNAREPGLRTLRVRPGRRGPGRVLAGVRLRSQTPHEPPYLDPRPQYPFYPDGQLPAGPTVWRNIAEIPPASRVFAADAPAIFNADGARYRIAFNGSYFGVDPTNIGDFGATGMNDLAIPDHYAFVDGMPQAGEVDIYFGRRGHTIDPRHDLPDVIFYGDEDFAKLGISVAPAGDVNGDGHADLLLAAAFHTTKIRGHVVRNAGRVYLIYGGFLRRDRCPVKIRISQIGRTVPGIVFDGGAHGSIYTGWANELDAGNFSGHGPNDVIIGASDPYAGAPAAPARAYLIYGSRRLPRYFVGYRLGIDTNRDGIRASMYSMPSGALTQEPLGFNTSFVGDLRGDGRDALSFSAGLADGGAGADYIFFAPPRPGSRISIPSSAPLTINGDDESSPPLRFQGLQGARPNGDVYGNGHQDALLSARYTLGLVNGGWQTVGAVGILPGQRSYPRTMGFSQLRTIIYGDEPGQIGQPAMASGADFDGDGCTDILINDTSYVDYVGATEQIRGRMWLVRGGPWLPHTMTLEENATRTFLPDTRLPGLFGFNWTTGDFNGDGRPDLVIADHYAGDDELHTFAGRDYLFLNRDLHLPWHPSGGCTAP